MNQFEDTLCTPLPLALRMKELKFPQPKLETGQFWWNHEDRLMMIAPAIEHPFLILFIDRKLAPENRGIPPIWTFAPTAMEIMNAEDNLVVRRHLDSFVAGSLIHGNIFIATIPPPGVEYKTGHEAAANEWILRHSPKSSRK